MTEKVGNRHNSIRITHNKTYLANLKFELALETVESIKSMITFQKDIKRLLAMLHNFE